MSAANAIEGPPTAQKFPRLQMSFTNTLVEGVEGCEDASGRLRAIRASPTQTLVEPEHAAWPHPNPSTTGALPLSSSQPEASVWDTISNWFGGSSRS